MNTWGSLLADLAIITLVVSLWTHCQDWIEGWPTRVQLVIFGLLGGCGTITLMLSPLTLRPGVLIDLRSTLVAISSFFGGPIAGAITALMAVVFRSFEGGVGAWAGCIGIAVAASVGMLGHLALKGRTPKRMHIVYLAGALAIAVVLSIFALPREIWTVILPLVAIPVAILNFLSTTISGLAFYQENRRREVTNANRLYRSIIEALPDCLNAKSLDGRFLAANPATAMLMRAESPAMLIGRTDFDFYPPATAQKFKEDEDRVLAEGVPSTIEQPVLHRDGSDGWLLTMKTPYRDQNGGLVGLITHNRDITPQKRLEKALAESQRHLSDALANMADGLVMFDRDGRLVFSNEQYRALFPRTADLRVPGALLPDILRGSIDRGEETVAPEDTASWIERITASFRVEGNRQIRLGDGRWLDARTRFTGGGDTLIVFSDITVMKTAEATLVRLNEELDRLSRIDGLTGIQNRRAFDAGLDKELARSARNQSQLSLLLFDVDRFKAFNDVYGHPAGDECLKAVADCLKATLRRPGDAAARYGGEEFAVILPDTDETGAFHMAERCRKAIRALGMVHAGSEKGLVTVSCGAATLITRQDAISLRRPAPARRRGALSRQALRTGLRLSRSGGRLRFRHSRIAL